MFPHQAHASDCVTAFSPLHYKTEICWGCTSLNSQRPSDEWKKLGMPLSNVMLNSHFYTILPCLMWKKQCYVNQTEVLWRAVLGGFSMATYSIMLQFHTIGVTGIEKDGKYGPLSEQCVRSVAGFIQNSSFHSLNQPFGKNHFNGAVKNVALPLLTVCFHSKCISKVPFWLNHSLDKQSELNKNLGLLFWGQWSIFSSHSSCILMLD